MDFLPISFPLIRVHLKVARHILINFYDIFELNSILEREICWPR